MNESFSHSGAWGITLIVIVLVSWFFYRYFAPKNWREWAGAGVVQAFIIALYAEMYGFPLTVYLLVRFFGLDSQFVSASLWSTLVGLGETGMLVSMLLGYGLAFTGIAIFIQGWRQVHRARREDRLVTDGLYAFVRHPQYTGLFIALFGEGVIHWPTLFSVGLFPVIVGVYTWLARREEQQVLARFGEAYRAYQRRVPMFLPRPGQWRRFTDAARHPPHEAGANTPIRAEHDVESEEKS
jgi:protein-S-isoprenylcysteine O-methyltransferase Ste14